MPPGPFAAGFFCAIGTTRLETIQRRRRSPKLEEDRRMLQRRAETPKQTAWRRLLRILVCRSRRGRPAATRRRYPLSLDALGCDPKKRHGVRTPVRSISAIEPKKDKTPRRLRLLPRGAGSSRGARRVEHRAQVESARCECLVQSGRHDPRPAKGAIKVLANKNVSGGEGRAVDRCGQVLDRDY